MSDNKSLIKEKIALVVKYINGDQYEIANEICSLIPDENLNDYHNGTTIMYHLFRQIGGAGKEYTGPIHQFLKYLVKRGVKFDDSGASKRDPQLNINIYGMFIDIEKTSNIEIFIKISRE